jgi:hypothetical protein
LSGTVSGGTLEIASVPRISIAIAGGTSYSESAQRLFPVPDGQGFNPFDLNDTGSPNLFALSANGSLQAGAAMTVLHLEEDDGGESVKLDLVLDDHFLVSGSADTEDFNIVGSKGDYKVSGRLTGTGQILLLDPLTVEFTISGTVCLRLPDDDD